VNSPVPGIRLLLDTHYVQALLNPRDAHHDRALSLLPQVKAASEVIAMEAVLTEVGNALSGTPRFRQLAVTFIRRCYTQPRMTVASIDSSLLSRALDLFEARDDKDWGLRERGVMDAATGDRHFQQAGFRALMLRPEP
jgi:predicted nucleic acid-binding protein